MSFTSVNPSTGELLETYPAESPAEMLEKIEKGWVAYRQNALLDFNKRSQALLSLEAALMEHDQELATLAAEEMGKPLQEGLEEVRKCAELCRYYATRGEAFLRPEPTDVEGAELHYRPLGLVVLITPWNFPFWQVLRKAVPILAAGNAVLLKPSHAVVGCALRLSALFERAPFPENVFQTLRVHPGELDGVMGHPAIAGVSFTGTTQSGRKVAGRNGWNLKRGVFELGGSDPCLVFADADLDLAARLSAETRLHNNGQSCLGAKRIVVESSAYKEFLDRIEPIVMGSNHGDPFDPAIARGPLAHEKARVRLQDQVAQTLKMGARLHCGGRVPKGSGFFYPATLLSDCSLESPVFHEETFGPVVVVVEAAGEEEMRRIANKSAYGMGASVFTGDLSRAERLARDGLECGIVGINRCPDSAPGFPFGGIKDSGFGRELGAEGIRAFTNLKTILRSPGICRT